MKKVACLAVLILGGLAAVFAQNAPDFDVIDAHGMEHRLYEDYLNQGKTVVLELFFVDCPPCNSIAPLVQSLYESWGSGNNDVEFFSLTVRTTDTDQMVLGFEAMHGLTFPGISEEGGGPMATIPYRNGTFGFYIGTPTFVVIAPDGSVNYGVRGSGMTATIDAIDAAIEATGAVKPDLSVPISGSVFTATGRPIPNAKVYVQGFPNNYVMTNMAGAYTLNHTMDDGVNYAIIAEKEDDFNVGVTVIDVLMMRKHFLYVDTFDNVFLHYAADLNGNLSVSSLDQVLATKLLAYVIFDLPGKSSPWIFLDSSYNFDKFYNNPAGARGREFNSQSDLNNLNLVGVKLGDLNDNSPLN
ncbi:MAG: redoxin domain-containing protein [Saprospiraceae bacterium]|nr:redoxin domain-containing protein [Saprospiraceae bacterium]